MSKKGDERKLVGMVFRSTSETELVQSMARDTKRFSQLQKELRMSTGNLNYHLVRMKSEGLVVKGDQGYSLSDAGRRIFERYLSEK